MGSDGALLPESAPDPVAGPVRLLVAALLLALFANQCVAAPRIVSLAPHLTELLFEIGAGPRIVGTVSYSDFPSAAKQIPRVGDATGVDIEKIISLHPDLVVGWSGGGQMSVAERLRSLGVDVEMVRITDLDSIAGAVRQLGQALDMRAAAERVAQRYNKRLENLRMKFQKRHRLRVFYQVWEQPLMTINRDQVVNDVIRGCGGENLFQDLNALVASISIEAVLKKNPQVILAPVAAKQAGAPLAHWHKWAFIDAVRYGNLYTVDADIISRQSTRILDGMEQVCQVLEQSRKHLERPLPR